MTQRPTEKKPPTITKDCGTPRGYRQHVKRGEHTCEPCKKANREYMASRRDGATYLHTSPEPRIRKRRREKEQGEVIAAAVEAIQDDTDPDDPNARWYPAFLKRRGRMLWQDVTASYDLSEAQLVILGNVCRMVDTLERFTAALASKSTLWFELDAIENADEAGVPVVINSMISESRQLTAQIDRSLKALGVLDDAKAKSSGTSVLDELAARRAKRLAGGQ